MTIWLIDDDPFALKLMARQLEDADQHDIESHSDPKQALARLLAEHDTVHMLVLDLQMPGIDGIEFIRELARTGFGGHLVLVSGEDSRILGAAKALAEQHELHLVGSLSKPVDPEDWRAVLDGAAAPCPAATHAQAPKTVSADDLRQAVESGAFINHYEPQVDLATGALVGVETLVRWPHPDHGLVYPGQFVGELENHGLMDEATRGILRNALHQLREWRQAGLELRVSVNVSMDSLQSIAFPDFVIEEAAGAGVSPNNLVLEITESQALQDAATLLDIAARLRLKRIGLSIDDFGTGHSSLSQLHAIPFDELKIDRGFVHGAKYDHELSAIVESSVAMARKLGLKTVAEGIETREDWDFARSAGCDIAQGYFIARAMPTTEFAGWHRDWRQRCGDLMT